MGKKAQYLEGLKEREREKTFSTTNSDTRIHRGRGHRNRLKDFDIGANHT